jgi:hypothetical protein
VRTSEQVFHIVALFSSMAKLDKQRKRLTTLLESAKEKIPHMRLDGKLRVPHS